MYGAIMDNNQGLMSPQGSVTLDVILPTSRDPNQKMYRTCGNKMHSVTATYIISYVHAFVYLSLFVYQLIVAINVSIEIFGAVVYIPCILTSVFVLGSIGSTILTTIAIPKKEYDWLDYLSYFIYASILYSTYLWVFTILPFEKEYEWLDFMRVQLESKPRLVTGMLEQNSTWQDFQSDSMSLRTGFFCFLYSGLLIFGYSSILPILTCQIFLCEQAEIASEDTVLDYLVPNEAEPTEVSTMIEMQDGAEYVTQASLQGEVSLSSAYTEVITVETPILETPNTNKNLNF